MVQYAWSGVFNIGSPESRDRAITVTGQIPCSLVHAGKMAGATGRDRAVCYLRPATNDLAGPRRLLTDLGD